jgi:hypothetical protein
MEELIKLREYIVEEKEQAFKREFAYKEISNETGRVSSIGYQTACSDIIEQLDLILNNSVVKPLVSSSLLSSSEIGLCRICGKQMCSALNHLA